jgi:imidazolonepropionase-like amidohydrolase
VKSVVLGKLLIDGTGGDPLWDPVICVENERIVHITTIAEWAGSDQADQTVVDCREKAILPGLVDSHVHLCFSAGPDHQSVRETFVDEDRSGLLPFRAARNAQMALLGGVTTLRDAGGRGTVTLGLRQAVRDGIVVGPRILSCGMPITTSTGHLNFCGLRAESEAEIQSAVQLLCDSGVDSIKVMATGGVMTRESNPAASQYTSAQLGLLTREAHARGRGVEAHVLNTEALGDCIAAGVDLLAHCVWVDAAGNLDYRPEWVDAMVEQNIYVGMTASGIYRRLLPDPDDSPAERESKYDQLRAHPSYVPLRSMRQAGVKIMVHSDAGVRFTPFHTFAQSLQAMRIGLDLPPAEVIRSATQVPAEALGLSHEIGTLEPGKRADLIAVDMNPLEDITCVGQVDMVMRDGSVVAERGYLLHYRRSCN